MTIGQVLSKIAAHEWKGSIWYVERWNGKIPTNLFEKVEEELTKLLIAENTEEMGEETDSAFDVIANIVGKIKHQIEKENFNEGLKNFLFTLTKILLNIKVDTGDKIIKIVQPLNSLIAKKWLEQNYLLEEWELEGGHLENHQLDLK